MSRPARRHQQTHSPLPLHCFENQSGAAPNGDARIPLRTFLADIASMTSPVFSVYVRRTAEAPVKRDGWAARHVRTAARAAGCEAQAQALTEALRWSDPVRRMVMGFADTERHRVLSLDAELPGIGSERDNVQWRLGEAFTAPLELALLSRPHYGVAVVEKTRVRFFSAFLGNFEELATFTQPPVPGSDDSVQSSKQVFPSFVPSRGGAAHDLVDRHVDEWLRHFLRTTARDLGLLIERHRMDRLLVIGERPLTRVVEDIAEHWSTHVPLLFVDGNLAGDPDGERARILDEIERSERVREGEAMELVPDAGIVGVEATVDAINTGRALAVIMPADLPGEVHFDGERGLVATSATQAQALSISGPPRPWAAVLPALARARNILPLFVTGAARAELVDRHGGMAVLPRW